MKNNVLKVYDLDNRIAEVYIGVRDHISDHHCLRCGSRIVVYSGDPHNVPQCPVCDMYPPAYKEDYSDAKQIEEIERYIIKLTEKLNHEIKLLKVLKGLTPVREKNLKDKAMKENND